MSFGEANYQARSVPATTRRSRVNTNMFLGLFSEAGPRLCMRMCKSKGKNKRLPWLAGGQADRLPHGSTATRSKSTKARGKSCSKHPKKMLFSLNNALIWLNSIKFSTQNYTAFNAHGVASFRGLAYCRRSCPRCNDSKI